MLNSNSLRVAACSAFVVMASQSHASESPANSADSPFSAFPTIDLGLKDTTKMKSLYGDEFGSVVPLGRGFVHSFVKGTSTRIDVGVNGNNLFGSVGFSATSGSGEPFKFGQEDLSTTDLKAAGILSAGMAIPFTFAGNKNVKGVFALSAFTEIWNLNAQVTATEKITGKYETFLTKPVEENFNLNRGVGFNVTLKF